MIQGTGGCANLEETWDDTITQMLECGIKPSAVLRNVVLSPVCFTFPQSLVLCIRAPPHCTVCTYCTYILLHISAVPPPIHSCHFPAGGWLHNIGSVRVLRQAESRHGLPALFPCCSWDRGWGRAVGSPPRRPRLALGAGANSGLEKKGAVACLPLLYKEARILVEKRRKADPLPLLMWLRVIPIVVTTGAFRECSRLGGATVSHSWMYAAALLLQTRGGRVLAIA